jgi:broad specificity phosphatase PhoE
MSPVLADQAWPDLLWLVRHGQSAGNVARDSAEQGGLALIDIDTRDADTPLSALGRQQSDALGNWFAGQPPERRPEIILVSPYVRAHETARIVAGCIDLEPRAPAILVDERLREKEFGILDRYTVHGIREKFPELAQLRARVGKFYFRPPGGESWCDVILRLRSMIDTISRDHRGRRVLIADRADRLSCPRASADHPGNICPIACAYAVGRR